MGEEEEAVPYRVESGPDRGTVRWAGGVEGTEGRWLGVEWDTEGRGRHDGDHQGTKYFQPHRTGGFCSFLRPGKVTAWGRGLVAAVAERYGAVEGDTAGVEEDGMRDLRDEIGARFVEVVGFDKVNREQSELAGLRTVSVAGLGVRGRWGRGEEGQGDLALLLPALRDLDLSQSLVSDWAEVAALAHDLRLEVLDLSHNLVPVPCPPPALRLAALRHLVLGRMLPAGYSWPEVLQLAGSCLPALAILQLHGNGLTALGPVPAGALAALEELDLDDNLLSDWAEVEHLASLPRLARLRLNGNRLCEPRPGPGSFPALRSLQLSGNLLATYQAVGRLDTLGLHELRLRNNPLNRSARDEETVRQVVVARLASLTSLNGSLVLPTERKWAEIDYLKTHGVEWLAIGDMPEAEARAAALEVFLDLHNRYDAMVARHGEPLRGEGVPVDTSLKSSLLKLRVRSPDLLGSAETVKKVPGSMTVAKLRALLRRLYRAAAGSAPLDLFLVGQDEAATEVRLDNDLRELSFYSVAEGDIVLVRWAGATETDL